MAGDDVRVQGQVLKQFSQQIFEKVGFSPEDAATQSELLIWANLRGTDSHGVLRIPWYVQLVDKGQMKARPAMRIEKDTPAVFLVDADFAPGPVVTVMAMTRAIEKARNVGIGWGLIRNTMHQGAMAYYALMAAQAGMAGLTFVCNPPNMAPYGARVAGVHNSPIAIAVPGKDRKPLCLDMATSIAARGKIDLAVDKGVPIPLGWALDKAGKPTTDPQAAAVIMPAGGYKGSGMALLFECLSSLMAGNPLLLGALQGKPGALEHRQNSVVAAVNISLFTDLEAFRQNADSTGELLKKLPTAEGFSEVQVPGEPEDRVAADRGKHGIPLPAGTVKNLRQVAERFGVTVPF